jgi:hypothetical protein
MLEAGERGFLRTELERRGYLGAAMAISRLISKGWVVNKTEERDVYWVDHYRKPLTRYALDLSCPWRPQEEPSQPEEPEKSPNISHNAMQLEFDF